MSGWGTVFNNTNMALRLHSNTLAKLQEQAATGSRVIRPSDAPVDAWQILSLRADSESLATYSENIHTVTGNLQSAHTALQDISSQVATKESSLRVTLTQICSGIYDPSLRRQAADAAEMLVEQVVSLANSKRMGHYLFGGSNTSEQPYEIVRDATGKITDVVYHGDNRCLEVPVAPGVTHSATLVGEDIFRTDDRAEPIFLGETGAAAGAATSSARGDVWLLVTHSSTDYQAGSGLAEGTDAASDTILGAHVVHVDGPAGTIQLDDGPVVNFDGSETNLALTNAAGDVAYVDVTAFNMGTAGDFSASGNGEMSIDEGASTVAIDFADANQAVTDSVGGGILYVDGRNIVRAGVEPVRIPGTYDMFGAVLNIRDLLLNTHDLPDQEQQDLLAEAVDSLDEVTRGLTNQMASLGARQQVMESLGFTLTDMKASADDQAAVLENADILEVAVELARAQTLYQMTLVTASKLLSLSLLDFI